MDKYQPTIFFPSHFLNLFVTFRLKRVLVVIIVLVLKENYFQKTCVNPLLMAASNYILDEE